MYYIMHYITHVTNEWGFVSVSTCMCTTIMLLCWNNNEKNRKQLCSKVMPFILDYGYMYCRLNINFLFDLINKKGTHILIARVKHEVITRWTNIRVHWKRLCVAWMCVQVCRWNQKVFSMSQLALFPLPLIFSAHGLNSLQNTGHLFSPWLLL